MVEAATRALRAHSGHLEAPVLRISF